MDEPSSSPNAATSATHGVGAKPAEAEPADAEPVGAEPAGAEPAADAEAAADGKTVASEPRRWEVPRPRPSVPRSFQSRLTIAFVAVVVVTLGLTTPVIINRLDDILRQQEEQALQDRAQATVTTLWQLVSLELGNQTAVSKDASGNLVLNPKVSDLLASGTRLDAIARTVAQADVQVEFGPAQQEPGGTWVTDPDPKMTFAADWTGELARGQGRDTSIAPAQAQLAQFHPKQPWGLQVTLSNPTASRSSTLTSITGVLLVMALVAVAVAILLASFMAHRFATPVVRLTDASRRVAEGDLSARVNAEASSGTQELQALTEQFNTMADRLQGSVEIIRRDRDQSRDFLADVSHELRTPIAAMTTFIELLQGPAGRDSAARAEFLESSAAQLDRLDWLAQNLLELSKLDSGLVLLELRPDDVRGTIESAVEQHMASAERKGINLTASLPDRPLRIRHDGPRVGQVVGNLVGNALKFTGRGGEVHVSATREADGGVRIAVVDTGVGIRAAELPHIFERFYRGSQANEARGTGSGLGLSIVKSIVDMHHGTIEVASRVGHGSRFTITLPRDPDAPDGRPGPPTADSGQKIDDSSPGAGRD
jgi:signal transduction histidine kinase